MGKGQSKGKRQVVVEAVTSPLTWPLWWSSFAPEVEEALRHIHAGLIEGKDLTPKASFEQFIESLPKLRELKSTHRTEEVTNAKDLRTRLEEVASPLRKLWNIQAPLAFTGDGKTVNWKVESEESLTTLYVHPGLLDALTSEEARFVLGHALVHNALGHGEGLYDLSRLANALLTRGTPFAKLIPDTTFVAQAKPAYNHARERLYRRLMDSASQLTKSAEGLVNVELRSKGISATTVWPCGEDVRLQAWLAQHNKYSAANVATLTPIFERFGWTNQGTHDHIPAQQGYVEYINYRLASYHVWSKENLQARLPYIYEEGWPLLCVGVGHMCEEKDHSSHVACSVKENGIEALLQELNDAKDEPLRSGLVKSTWQGTPTHQALLLESAALEKVEDEITRLMPLVQADLPTLDAVVDGKIKALVIERDLTTSQRRQLAQAQHSGKVVVKKVSRNKLNDPELHLVTHVESSKEVHEAVIAHSRSRFAGDYYKWGDSGSAAYIESKEFLTTYSGYTSEQLKRKARWSYLQGRISSLGKEALAKPTRVEEQELLQFVQRGHLAPGVLSKARKQANALIKRDDKVSASYTRQKAKIDITQELALRLLNGANKDEFVKLLHKLSEQVKAADKKAGYQGTYYTRHRGDVDTEPNRIAYVKNLVSAHLAAWAQSAGDSSESAVVIQMAAVDEFKLPKTHLDILKKYNDKRDKAFWLAASKTYSGIDGDVARAVLRAMFEHTQEIFAAEGITHVSLFRGMCFAKPLELLESLSYEEVVRGKVALQPLSSWSSSMAIARRFARKQPGSVVLHATVPVSRVLGCARTGLGCLNEYEYVLLDRGTKTSEYLLEQCDASKRTLKIAKTYV